MTLCFTGELFLPSNKEYKIVFHSNDIVYGGWFQFWNEDNREDLRYQEVLELIDLIHADNGPTRPAKGAVEWTLEYFGVDVGEVTQSYGYIHLTIDGTGFYIGKGTYPVRWVRIDVAMFDQIAMHGLNPWRDSVPLPDAPTNILEELDL